jgi:hypothetical protein
VLYFDTAFVRRPPADRVEFSSLIAREVRIGGLDVQAAGAANARFEALLQESFVVLLPNAEDKRDCEQETLFIWLSPPIMVPM